MLSEGTYMGYASFYEFRG